MIVGGLSLLVIGSVVAAAADTLAGLAVGRLLQGSGAIASATMALAADYTRVEQRTKASAIIGVSIGVSFALALVLGPVLAAWGGLPRVFEVTAVMGGLGLMVVLFGCRRRPSSVMAAVPILPIENDWVRPSGVAVSGCSTAVFLSAPSFDGGVHSDSVGDGGAGGAGDRVSRVDVSGDLCVVPYRVWRYWCADDVRSTTLGLCWP